MMTILLLVAAQAAASTGPTLSKPAESDEALIAAARRAMDENMVDYPSVRLRDMRKVILTPQVSRVAHVRASGEHVVYCGKANMKNQAGGFTGWGDIAVIAKGNSSRRVIFLPKGGFEEVIELTTFCPWGSGVPEGAVIDPADVSAKLSPVVGYSS